MKTKKIRIKGKIIEVEECKTLLSKTRGLMFRKNSKALLFNFKKPTRQPIHSFFCMPFLAIWRRNNKIIEEKVVKPFCLFIKPKQLFTELIEIPLRNSKKN